MPVDAVAALEAAASYPHVTSALAEMRGITLSYDQAKNNAEGGINTDVIKLSQRFAMLMGEYNISIEDGVISMNEAKRLLRETTALQKVLLDMKLHLEEGKPLKMDLSDLPNIVQGALHPIDFDALKAAGDTGHPPRILLLYGSLRHVSYSRLAAMEAARILRALGCETRMFDPSGLPLPDDADESLTKSPNCAIW